LSTPPITAQIQALAALASVDAELKVLDDQLAQERSTLAGLKDSLKSVQEKLASDRAALTACEKNRNELQADLRTMQTQIEHSRDKMNRARTERETNAVQREMEELRKLVRDREDDMMKLGGEAENIRAQVTTGEEEAGKIEKELSANEGDINSRVGQVQAQRDEKQKERDVAVKAIPPALLRRYDHIRSKRSGAVATTTDGTCKACNMSLPPQLFHRLNREPIIEQCPSCNRLIYYVAPAPPPEKS
jgi:predicted  nucleic acid-binding Zn-ribbon protein